MYFRTLLRRESFTSQREPSSQWFDRPESQVLPPQPIIELSEQVTTPVGVAPIDFFLL